MPEVELGIREQGERERPRDRLDRGALNDQSRGVLPSLGHLAVLRQRRHVGDRVTDGAQRAAIRRGQRLGELGREVCFGQGHRRGRRMRPGGKRGNRDQR